MSDACRHTSRVSRRAAAPACAGRGGCRPILADCRGHGARRDAAVPRGKAEHCIIIWLGGGAWADRHLGPQTQGRSQGQEAPAPTTTPIDTAIPGVQVCEHLRAVRQMLDRFNLVRTVHHDVIDEHAAATNRMHTGRPTSGTIVYPSIGSIVAPRARPGGRRRAGLRPDRLSQRDPRPGFPRRQARLRLPDRHRGRPGRTCTRPDGHRPPRGRRAANGCWRKLRANTCSAPPATGRSPTTTPPSAEALRLAGPEFMSVFELDSEPADLRERYGGEFGQRCLLSRRLVAVGRAVHRGFAQPELRQRHRLGHPQRRPAEPARADPGTRPAPCRRWCSTWSSRSCSTRR